MAATPPRPSSPVTRHMVVPKPGHTLQISPNLEALLEHDELTRRNSGSPTSLHHSISQASPSGFAVSLPPPPRNIVQVSRKTSQRDQDAASIPRTREVQKKRSTNIRSDFWSDALPAPMTEGQSPSNASSRSVTPNPYINPTPVLRPINIPAEPVPVDSPDQLRTPKTDEKPLPNEPNNSDMARPAGLNRGRSSASETPNRSSAPFNKMEKILWLGRDSLSLFANSSCPKRHEADRRSARSERVSLATSQMAVQGEPVRQVTSPVAPNQNVPRDVSRFGDADTATVLSSESGSSNLHALQQGSLKISPKRSSSCCESTQSNDPSSIRTYAATSLPRLSLPSIFMPYHSPPRLQPIDSNASHDYLSFIDFLSPSFSGVSNSSSLRGNSTETPAPRWRVQSLTVSSPDSYTTSHHNLSLASLASMRFAPPSPTSVPAEQPSPISPRYPPSNTSSSSVALSSMIFGPPSPSGSSLASTHLQPPSSPGSPSSPLEFATPPSPQSAILGKPSFPVFPEISQRGRNQNSGKRSVSASPHPLHHVPSSLPPTTNQLNAHERADRVRRNRKLARVFGRNPSSEEKLDVNEPRPPKKLPSPSFAALLGSGKPKSHRLAMSVSVKSPEPANPWQTDDLSSPGGRRHSTPLTPSFKFHVDGEPTDDTQYFPVHVDSRQRELTSPMSFIELSDEDVHDDNFSGITFLDTQRQPKPRHLYQSSSTPSLIESLDAEAQAELEHRQRREKLARLHRFLGSRVPLEAVLGGVVGPPLPPIAPTPLLDDGPTRDNRLRRRKHTVDTAKLEFDRGKEELGDKEKALNVRRAQKMGKVFGTPPPQTLYHTRPARPSLPLSQPTSPTAYNPFVLSLDLPSVSRNPNQSAYKGKKIHRPGSSDSSTHLLSYKDGNAPDSPVSFAQPFADSVADFPEALPESPVYLNYQHSLNSLVDIIDRDDRQSLVELHCYLQGDVEESYEEEEIIVNPRRISNGSSLKSERRLSLPTRASMSSLSSERVTTAVPSQFQLRRRRAAKLTNFFGVDYRELIHDILESIEKGVEEERKRGTLQPQEVEVLLHRVRSLRSLENQFA